MFGYVIPDKPNILIKDYTEYRAYYCGMCKAIGKDAGQLMRLSINYDITLLAMFAVNLLDEDVKIQEERCMTHWVKNRPIARCDRAFSIVSKINSILGYYKAKDDSLDEKKLLKGTVKALISPYYKKARKQLPEFDRISKEQYARLAALEKEAKASIDEFCDPFASIMVAAGKEIKDDANFADLCYNLGRWIYIIDALDDLYQDFTHHRFNPFLIGIKAGLTKEKHDEIIEQGKRLLYVAIDDIKNAYNKMDIRLAEGPLSNIIYLGLERRTEDILSKGEKNEKKSV